MTKAWTLSILPMLATACLAQTAPADKLPVNDKIGLYVTPPDEGSKHFPVSDAEALRALKGYARTVWVMDSWRGIETADGKFDWSRLDKRVDAAIENGFDVGIRAQLVLCGNDDKKQFVAISRVPKFVDADMSSADFQQKVVRFYAALAQRYKGKARYIAVGNSVNKYFDRYPKQWDGFQKAYAPIVKAIHAADPKVRVLSDIEVGGEYYEDKAKLQKYVDFFRDSGDDGVGLIFYFITKVYYGEFANFNKTRLGEVLDEIHGRTKKDLYILETSCFSKHPNKGTDMSGVQANYVDMLVRTVVEKDYILGLSWWQLYDAKDEPGVPWDIKVGFGLFDAEGKPKPAWETWKKLCTLQKPTTRATSQ